MILEEWRPIKGFEGYYEVSNLGSVRSLDRTIQATGTRSHCYTKHGSVLKAAKGSDGYWDVGLWRDNRPKYFSVHRLVAEAFIPNPENKPTVNHINCNKDDNTVSNLEWATNLEQMKHASDNKLLCNSRVDVSIQNMRLYNLLQTNGVICKETSEIFCSLSQASQRLGLSKHDIYISVKNGTRINNLTFESL